MIDPAVPPLYARSRLFTSFLSFSKQKENKGSKKQVKKEEERKGKKGGGGREDLGATNVIFWIPANYSSL